MGADHNSFIGNITGAPATPAALTPAQAKSLLAISASDVSGLGSLATAASVSLTSQVTGTLQAAQFPALSGDVTTISGSTTATIAASAITNAKLANMAALTFKANATTNAAAPQDLTIDQTLLALNMHAQLQARALIML